MDNRKQELLEFVRQKYQDQSLELDSLNGDASFRRYFRVKTKQLIAVDSPPATQKNHEFHAIDVALSKFGIKVPAILAEDLDRGFFVLEDLGDKMFADAATGGSQKKYYLKAADLLPVLAGVNDDSVVLPEFDYNFIMTELTLFRTWMLEKKLGINLSPDEVRSLHDCFEYISDRILSQQYVSMHRDFHSRNLMVCADGSLGVIDFQDMVHGPVTYDLASLIYDCYVNLDDSLIGELVSRVYNKFKSIRIISELSKEQFVSDLNITSLQRHIKVLGIFCRLSIRDGKDGYLADLPRVIDYCLKESSLDPNCSALTELLKCYVVDRF